MSETTLTYTRERREEARDRSALAAMVDVDSFLLSLDDIERLEAENKRLQTASKAALKEAVAAIYFDDNSDYLPALWSIVKRLGSEYMATQLEENEQAVYDQVCKEADAA